MILSNLSINGVPLSAQGDLTTTTIPVRPGDTLTLKFDAWGDAATWSAVTVKDGSSTANFDMPATLELDFPGGGTANNPLEMDWSETIPSNATGTLFTSLVGGWDGGGGDWLTPWGELRPWGGHFPLKIEIAQDVAETPEPGSIALFALGILGVYGARRHRRRPQCVSP
jgi:hypothetical protein